MKKLFLIRVALLTAGYFFTLNITIRELPIKLKMIMLPYPINIRRFHLQRPNHSRFRDMYGSQVIKNRASAILAGVFDIVHGDTAIDFATL